jgi:glycosyltransferase involved in cell wall biosynthesis
VRFLHVVHGLSDEAPAGTELYVDALAERQRSAAGGGHDVAIFARVKREAAPDLSLVDVAPTKSGVVRFGFNHLGRRGLSFVERDRFEEPEVAFAKACEAFRPDVVHVHHLAGLSIGVVRRAADAGAKVALTTHDHALACPRGRRVRLDLESCPTLDRERCSRCVRPAWIEAARAPSFETIVGALTPGRSRRLFDERDAAVKAALDLVGLFFAPSRSAAELFAAFYDPGDRLVTLPHGSPPPVDLAPPEPPGPNPFRVAFFGAAHPTKGARIAAEAIGRVPHDRARLLVNGAVDRAESTRLALAARGRIEFHGAYAPSELSARMALAQVVVVPSLFAETFSLTTREAFAHRRPVIASRIGALTEALGENEARGILVPPGDAEALARAILRLIEDPALFARLQGPFTDAPRDSAFDATTRAYDRLRDWDGSSRRG